MIGGAAALILIVIVGVAITVRFMRAVRRSLRDPEFRALFVLVILTLATGTIFYAWVEGWSVLDAFYFSAITLTTVGYGDLAPVTAAGKLFTVFYIFTGIGIIVGFVDTVAKASVEQREERQRRFGHRGTSEQDRQDE